MFEDSQQKLRLDDDSTEGVLILKRFLTRPSNQEYVRSSPSALDG